VIKSFLKKYFIPHSSNEYKPHFFRKATVLGIGGVAIVLFALSMGSSLLIQKTGMLANVYSGVLFDLTNQKRQSEHLPLFSVNPKLEEAARMKANDMLSNQYFDHISPRGITPWHWIDQAGYAFSYAGENLAVDFTETQDVENALLSSPLHRANILNTYFTEIGIATLEGVFEGQQTTLVVEMFGRPKTQKKIAQTAAVGDSQTSVQDVSPVSLEQPKTETPTESQIPTPEKETPLPQTVAAALGSSPFIENDGEPVQQTPVVSVEHEEDPAVMIVRNKDAEESETISETGVSPAPDAPLSAPKHESSWVSRLLLNEPHLIHYIFTLFATITLIALLLFIGIEIKIQHPKEILYGVMLFAVLVILIGLNHSLLITPTFIF